MYQPSSKIKIHEQNRQTLTKMGTRPKLKPSEFEYILSILVYGFLIIYTYALLFTSPYLGFSYNASNGEITRLYIQPRQWETLYPGDRILQVDSTPWESYSQNLKHLIFTNAQAGKVSQITVLRNNQRATVPWTYPGQNYGETVSRILNPFWLSYIFWGFGTAVFLLVRPKDSRWRLLIYFNYITAVWIIAGALSNTHLWNSAIVLRMALWMSIPIYWHLHWIFPQPLGRLPKVVIAGIYLAGLGLTIAQLYERLPASSYTIAFLLAASGSLLLLFLRALLHPEQWRDLRLVLFSVTAVFFPMILLSIARLDGYYPYFSNFLLIFLLVIPVSYFYIIYRRQLGGMEMRTNHAIIFFVYALLLLAISSISISIVDIFLTGPGEATLVGLVAAVVSGLGSIWLYPRFQRWGEYRLLGMPLPPTRLIESYTGRITTSLELPKLVNLIRDELLPSLLIRQAALLRLEGEHPATLFTLNSVQNSGQNLLPESKEIPDLIAQAGKLIQPFQGENHGDVCQWVRLVLPLSVDGRPIGLCLLGRRDPDDYYAANEIATLQALMDQTAVALLNIEQAERIRSLYRIDIERQEAEISRLALELHDDVLGQMAMLAMSTDAFSSIPKFEQAYQAATEHIRDIIKGLRPTMLNYGLRSAVTELADEATGLFGSTAEIQVDIPVSDYRYPAPVELHLYRIVQQACQNALKHSYASILCLAGKLEAHSIELAVIDNGIGFAQEGPLDLDWLLAHKHYGLAGMHERAALIGARLEIISSRKNGTRVVIRWNPGQSNPPVS
ncbi:MAG: GAF domain-containing sensor histidine kinase [Omnitrophica WOR_2 bacterium]